MTLEVAFGQILREIRQDQKISQEKLGFESGYHRTYIGLSGKRKEKSVPDNHFQYHQHAKY